MDQGAAAVWASAVAGVSSAAGAAFGSVLAGRAARVQEERTAQREKVARQETAVDERFADFSRKVSDALAALQEVGYALEDETPVNLEALKKASAAAYASYMGLFSTGKSHLAYAGEVVCAHLESTLIPVRALVGSRDAANSPDSEIMQALSMCSDNLQSAWQTYCGLVLMDETICAR